MLAVLLPPTTGKKKNKKILQVSFLPIQYKNTTLELKCQDTYLDTRHIHISEHIFRHLHVPVHIMDTRHIHTLEHMFGH